MKLSNCASSVSDNCNHLTISRVIGLHHHCCCLLVAMARPDLTPKPQAWRKQTCVSSGRQLVIYNFQDTEWQNVITDPSVRLLCYVMRARFVNKNKPLPQSHWDLPFWILCGNVISEGQSRKRKEKRAGNVGFNGRYAQTYSVWYIRYGGDRVSEGTLWFTWTMHPD